MRCVPVLLHDTAVNVSIQAMSNALPEDIGAVQLCGELAALEDTQVQFLLTVSPEEIKSGMYTITEICLFYT